MDKNDIIEYVMHTPHNTNRAVLSSMLNQLAEGGDDSGGSWTVLTEETVTTEQGGLGVVGVLAYSEKITADTIKVTFNGTEYTCQKMSGNDYGAPYNTSTRAFDWSEYPFNIMSDSGDNVLTTESAGTYTVKIGRRKLCGSPR